MTQVRSHGRQQVEDLPVMGRKTFVHFRRLKCRCPHCKKTRYEHVEFLIKYTKKITKRFAFFINKLSEFSPVTMIAEAVQIPTTSLWRHDLEILEAKFKQYEIPWDLVQKYRSGKVSRQDFRSLINWATPVVPPVIQ